MPKICIIRNAFITYYRYIIKVEIYIDSIVIFLFIRVQAMFLLRLNSVKDTKILFSLTSLTQHAQTKKPINIYCADNQISAS